MTKILKPKHKEFADNYLETNNATQAVKVVFPEITSDNSAGVKGSRLLRSDKIQQYLQDKAERASQIVFELAENAKNEMVKLNSAKDILDRAGYKAEDKKTNINIGFNLTKLFTESQKQKDKQQIIKGDIVIEDKE